MTQKPHHTPKGFRNNYVGSVTKSLGDVLRWQFDRLRHRLPPAPTVPTPQVAADLNFISRNARAGADMIPAVTWIGHASALVQASGLNVLTDPVFSKRVSPVNFAGPARAQPPGIALRDLPPIDVVVISHNHYDHLDRPSVVALSRQPGGSPLFLVPLGLKEWLEKQGITRAVELDWWGVHQIEWARGGPRDDGGATGVEPGGVGGPGKSGGTAGAGAGGEVGVEAGGARAVEFHLVPAQHWSGRSLGDRDRTLWGGWAVLGSDFHWYFTGDTGYSRDFIDIREKFALRQSPERGGGFDIALIAAGACLPRWFMQLQHVDLAEAVQVHLDLGAKCSVGVHWGTFALADDPLDQPIHELGAARQTKGVSEDSFFLLPVGGTRQLARRGPGKIAQHPTPDPPVLLPGVNVQ